MDIDWIKKQIREGDYEFSAHADEERQADKHTIDEIEHALSEGEVIIEDYPGDPRGQAALSWDMARLWFRFMQFAEGPSMAHCG